MLSPQTTRWSPISTRSAERVTVCHGRSFHDWAIVVDSSIEGSSPMSFRVTIRIDLDAEQSLGPGKIALLERMRSTKSLSQAARELGMSYRCAWCLLESLNSTFDEPVIITSVGGKHGGGSEITPFGLMLIEAYRGLERDVVARAQRALRNVRAQAKAPSSTSARLKRTSVSKRS
jgi:molybdate transport system regulatory protein